MQDLPDIAFGTSGLRGLAEGFTPERVAAYLGAFLAHIGDTGGRRALAIGLDLRPSSPAIAAMVAAAAQAEGWEPLVMGTVPTPALAFWAGREAVPAVMVTGSHIPSAYNGLKFYRPAGEMLKSDEAPVREGAERRLVDPASLAIPALPPVRPDAEAAYRTRYLDAFAPDALSGITLGVYQHSAVGRDALIEILGALGARCIAFGRSDSFVPVDTEALARDQRSAIAAFTAGTPVDAVISTDGDGDRPLLIDEAGNQIPGDILGALTARALGLASVVTPLTSTSAIEMSGWFDAIERTRVGSPYVVEAMSVPGAPPCGFEANGGFLLGTPIAVGRGQLAPLATRDALLPLIATLTDARRRGVSLSRLAAQLPARVMRSGRISPVEKAASLPFLDRIATDPHLRAAIAPWLAAPASIDTRDGVRFGLADDRVVHFRQSGNAPELRCYVETGSLAQTAEMLDIVLDRLAEQFGVPKR